MDTDVTLGNNIQQQEAVHEQEQAFNICMSPVVSKKSTQHEDTGVTCTKRNVVEDTKEDIA